MIWEQRQNKPKLFKTGEMKDFVCLELGCLLLGLSGSGAKNCMEGSRRLLRMQRELASEHDQHQQ